MASFTDQLVAFNPYTPQIPVDDYVRVGMIKQQQYDQGVQKVQGYIDSVAGLDVIKPEQKDYLQQRVGQLQGEVSSIVQRDFSNQQLVNSVGNLTSKISSDPIIQNAVISTHNYRTASAKMKEAQEKGKSSPSNEYVFQRQVQNWLGDKDVSSTFNGDFIEYTDYKKKMIDVLDKQLGHPDEKLEDIPYQRGQNGKILLDKDGQPSIDYAMMVKSYKGVSPERIKAVLESALDENDKRQLQMDGQYEYRGADKNAMKSIADQSYSYRLGQINDTIKGLLVERQTNLTDPGHISQVDAQIDALKSKAQSYQNQYKQDIQSIDKNLEGYKGQLYQDNWEAKFDEGMSYAQYSLTYKENPFFTAAEKKRENDIKFQEYIMNKQFEGAKLDIERAKLGFEQQKMDIERLKLQILQKKAGIISGGGGALPLTGSDIREPIDQATLEKITVDTYDTQTQAMSNDVDNQKMALLAQTRPDLVHVVRDPDGKNPHYEYDVAGKNPDAVKAQAEATVGKLKESYDKDPLSVDDGTKTYFDNLANTSLRVENRKFAMNQLKAQADRVHDITPLLSKVSPLTVDIPGIGRTTVTAEDMMNFNRKMQTIIEPNADAPDAPNYNYDLASKTLSTPAEKYLATIERKKAGVDRTPVTQEEERIWNKLGEVVRKINVPAEGVLGARTSYMSNAVREIVGSRQGASFPIEGFKPEDRGRVQSVVGDLFNTIVGAGKSNPNPNYDQGSISKMLDVKNHANTTYSLVSKSDGTKALRITNTNVSDKPAEIDITKDQANDLFGSSVDDFEAVRDMLQLSKATGKVTTDIQGRGKETAFSLNNGLVQNYGVKYHVEDPLKNGGLQVKLYIYDKSDKTWKEKNANFGQLLDEAQVTKALSSLTDGQIDNLLGKNK